MLKEEHGLRVFENRVMEEVTGGWRKMHDGQLHNVVCTLHRILLEGQMKDVKMGGTCSTHVKDEKCVEKFG
jgi:hypothetical protein